MKNRILSLLFVFSVIISTQHAFCMVKDGFDLAMEDLAKEIAGVELTGIAIELGDERLGDVFYEEVKSLVPAPLPVPAPSALIVHHEVKSYGSIISPIEPTTPAGTGDRKLAISTEDTKDDDKISKSKEPYISRTQPSPMGWRSDSINDITLEALVEKYKDQKIIDVHTLTDLQRDLISLLMNDPQDNVMIMQLIQSNPILLVPALNHFFTTPAAALPQDIARLIQRNNIKFPDAICYEESIYTTKQVHHVILAFILGNEQTALTLLLLYPTFGKKRSENKILAAHAQKYLPKTSGLHQFIRDRKSCCGCRCC